jgi:hypothetical protein
LTVVIVGNDAVGTSSERAGRRASGSDHGDDRDGEEEQDRHEDETRGRPATGQEQIDDRPSGPPSLGCSLDRRRESVDDQFRLGLIRLSGQRKPEELVGRARNSSIGHRRSISSARASARRAAYRRHFAVPTGISSSSAMFATDRSST